MREEMTIQSHCSVNERMNEDEAEMIQDMRHGHLPLRFHNIAFYETHAHKSVGGSAAEKPTFLSHCC